MPPTSDPFQVFAKPVGSACNLDCSYCYYVSKSHLAGKVMSDDLLERYIIQHLEACSDDTVLFSWHGGEPLLAGTDFYRKAVSFQKKYARGRRIINGIQTNGTLITEEWCNFLSGENFIIGLSLDGPERFHNSFRLTKNGKPTFATVMNAWQLLRKHRIVTELLCVVNSVNVDHPLEIYRFFRQIGAGFITFLPLVERTSGENVSSISVPPAAFGTFLCTVFDEWIANDIGRIKVQVFEETAMTAFRQEHTLCIFKKECGRVPVVESNGDFYSCDHYVDPAHLTGNVKETSLTGLLEHPDQVKFGKIKFNSLPKYCLSCEVLSMCNGECPKNRFIRTPVGEEGLNYLCAGYRKFFGYALPFVKVLENAHRNITPPQPLH